MLPKSSEKSQHIHIEICEEYRKSEHPTKRGVTLGGGIEKIERRKMFTSL